MFQDLSFSLVITEFFGTGTLSGDVDSRSTRGRNVKRQWLGDHYKSHFYILR